MDLIGYLRRIMNKDVNETFAPATDSLEAIRDFLASGGSVGGGGWYYGVVTAAAAPSFTIATLAGLGDAKFTIAAGTYYWSAIVFRDAGGLGAAPQGEMQNITAYVSATGTFTAGAYTVPVAVGDEILIAPRLAMDIIAILNFQYVPAADAVANGVMRDVIGQKSDSYVWSPTVTASQMRYLKALLDSSGLVYRGTVTEVPNATSFRVAELIGMGSTFFRNWFVYVLWDNAGLGAAPQDEYTIATAFNSPDATFTHAAFTAQLAVGDRVLLLHPWLFGIVPDTTEAVYAHPNSILEQTVFTIAIAATTKVNSLFLDLVNLTQNATIRVKVQIDGVNYRTIETFNWTTGMDDGVFFREITANHNVQVTIQSAVLEGGVRNIPYQYSLEG